MPRAAHAEILTLPPLAIDTRGELLLDDQGAVHYQAWQLQPLPADVHIGLLMVLPARSSSEKQIAPLEEAMIAKNYDYRRLTSTSIINLDDAMFGAGLMVEGRLSKEKRAKPRLHLVIDKEGDARRALDLAEGTIHVLLYDCRAEILHHHQGEFAAEQVQQILARIDQALQAAPCGVSQQVQ